MFRVKGLGCTCLVSLGPCSGPGSTPRNIWDSLGETVWKSMCAKHELFFRLLQCTVWVSSDFLVSQVY